MPRVPDSEPLLANARPVSGEIMTGPSASAETRGLSRPADIVDADYELVDAGLSLDALVWRLFHEEAQVRVQPGEEIRRGCRCSADH